MNIQKAIRSKYGEDKPNYAPIERTTFTIPEVSEYVGISKDFAYKLTRENKIPHIRIGSRIMLKRDSIDRWLNELEQEE